MRLAGCDRNHFRIVLMKAGRNGGRGGESTGHSRGAQQRLALLSKPRIVERARAARFVIQQDRPDHRFHVAANSSPVIVERLNDSINVIAAGAARDEPLDKLPANKWADIFIVENRIERLLEILKTVRIELGS